MEPGAVKKTHRAGNLKSTITFLMLAAMFSPNISLSRLNKLADQRLSMDSFCVASEVLFDFSPLINTSELCENKFPDENSDERFGREILIENRRSPNMLRASLMMSSYI